MKTFLLVTAGVFAGFVLFLIIGVWLLKWKFKSTLELWSQVLDGLVSGMADMPKLRMKLEPAGDTPWRHPEAVTESVNLLVGRGFEEAGRYLVNGRATVIMTLFIHPAEKLTAVLYDSASQKPCLDVGMKLESGDYHFYTNVRHDGFEKPQWCTYVRRAELSNADLLEAAMIESPTDDRVVFTAESLPHVIEDCYEREMLWRVNRGGYTEQEIRRTVEAAGLEATPENMQRSRAVAQGVLLRDVEDMLRDRFLEATSMTADRWEQLEDRLAIIHPMSDADTLTHHLATLQHWSDDEGNDPDNSPWEQLKAQVEEQRRTANPMEVFSALAAESPRANELEHLGRLDEPVAADFYTLPLREMKTNKVG